jgi:membrane protein
MMGGSAYRAVRRAVLRCVERVWHDLRFKTLYRRTKEFELMERALGFAALALLTIIPLLILVAAASPAPHRGLAGWVVYGMGLTGSSADAVTRLFSAPSRVLGTTGVFSALVLSVSGVALAGSVQGGFERIWALPAGPWHKIWRQAVWLVILIAYIYAAATVGTVTNGGLAETAGRVAVAVVLGIAFFWWGLRFLLGGRVSYLAALPGAAATLVGLAGLRAFSSLVFEPLIIRNAVSYGALGTVLIVESWLIGVGWVLYGGQLFGHWFYEARLQGWAERRASHSTPPELAGSRRLRIARQETVDQAVAAASLEWHVGTKKALAGKPATLGDVLRRLIVWTARQLQPGQSQLSERPLGEQADSLRRGTPAAASWGEPVANPRAAMIQANLIEGDGTEHHVPVVRFDQGEVQLIAPQAAGFLLSEEVARISLGVGSITPGEPLHQRITERQHYGRYVGLAPRAQQHHITSKRRYREPEFGHVEMISLCQRLPGY